MHLLEIIIVFVVAITLSNVASHFFPDIPASLFQISLGLILSFTWDIRIEVETEWFMLLFVAPLLYNDAWRFPKRELWALRGRILGNAIILVFLTTLLGGYLIHLLMPELPKTVALALAAVVSPTDPVAVHAIARRVKLPANIMHVVAGESLVNDASGLVAFNTAIKATIAGTFLFSQAVAEFAWMVAGGVIYGVVLGTLLSWLVDILVKIGMKEMSFHISLTMLAPFAIYWMAEEIGHTSGVIAVVIAAIIANIHARQSIAPASPELQVISVSVWSYFTYLLNGIIFVLLGMEIPLAVEGVIADPNVSTAEAIYYGVVVWFIIFAIRVSWTYISQWFLAKKQRVTTKGVFKHSVISGLTGVRGAVTMAAVLSVAPVMPNDHAFPQYDLMIFTATIVVIVSLLVATVMLPIMTHEHATSDFTQQDMNEDLATTVDVGTQADMNELQARIFALQYGMQVIKGAEREENGGVIRELIFQYQTVITKLQNQYHDHVIETPFMEKERELRALAINAEFNALQKLLVQENISQLVYEAHAKRLDKLRQLTVENNHRLNWWNKAWIINICRVIYRTIFIWLSDEDRADYKNSYQKTLTITSKAAVKTLSHYVMGLTMRSTNNIERQVAANLINSYRHQISNHKKKLSPKQAKQMERLKLELEVIGLNAQREATQELYEAGRITRQVGIDVRQYINYAETAVLEGEPE